MVNKQSLYEIITEIEVIISNPENYDEDGALTQEAEAKLNQLEINEDKKIENIIAYVKNLQSFASELKEEEAKLKQRRQSKEKQADNLTNYLRLMLERKGVDKYESTKGIAAFRKGSKLEIKDYEKIPDELKNDILIVNKESRELAKEMFDTANISYSITEKPDMNGIKAYIKSLNDKDKEKFAEIAELLDNKYTRTFSIK